MASNDTSAYLLVAQQVICAYPISDTYAPTPRYLYYVLLFLSFVLPHDGWLAKIVLGGAAAYAATAAIDVFVIISAPRRDRTATMVSVPFISNSSSLSLHPVVEGIGEVLVQPDALELDLDAILAIVVTAYLTCLPLQAWSWTARGSRVVHYMVLSWNLLLLAAVVCSLVAWPSTNTAPPQYRFCYEGFPDPSSQANEDPAISPWLGTWNSTIHYFFDGNSSNAAWQNLSDNCIYPCFNTTQIIRQSSSLKATVDGEGAKFAKLHSQSHYEDLGYAALIYPAIITTTVAQVFLLLIGRFKLCSRNIPIYEPICLWWHRKLIWRHFSESAKESLQILRHSMQQALHWLGLKKNPSHLGEAAPTFWHGLLIPLRLIIDAMTALTLVTTMTLFPVVIICFVVWIEWYIRNDGTPSESPKQVGQWAPLVSVIIVFIAGVAYQFKRPLATREELMSDIEAAEANLLSLQNELRKRDRRDIQRIEMTRNEPSSAITENIDDITRKHD